MIRPLTVLLALALAASTPSLAAAQGGVVRLGSAFSEPTEFNSDGDEVVLTLNGHYASLRVDINGAIGGGSTITVSCSVDGTTYDAIPLNGPSPATTTDTDGAVTTTGQYTAGVASCRKVRAVASAWGTGSPTVTLSATASGGSSTAGAAGGGDASLAEQETQTAHLAAIETAVEILDNAVSGTGINISQIGGAAPAAAICDDPAKITTFNINLGAGTGNTELVALNGADLIYVCSFVYTTGGADTPQLIYGTGAACATGETDLMTLNLAAAGDGYVENGGGSVITKAPAGNALCLERTNSVTAMGRLGYVRQP